MRRVETQARPRLAVLSRVVAVLHRESGDIDGMTDGALSVRDICMIVRDDLDPRPSTAGVASVLVLREHPYVAAVGKTAEGSTAIGAVWLCYLRRASRYGRGHFVLAADHGGTRQDVGHDARPSSVGPGVPGVGRRPNHHQPFPGVYPSRQER